jgi:1-acyl-sn-glycerol-3-phosphate acyltransferase
MRQPHPPKSFWFAHVVRVTLGNLLIGLFRVAIPGAERIPSGGAVLAGNHVSYGDPVLLWCRSPHPVHFMAKMELWDHNVFGWGLDHFWAFPVRRGAADRTSLQQASAVLQEGGLVGVFPSGSRWAEEAEAQGGAAFLAIRNGVPVVPIGIAGTDRIKPPGSRMIHFPKVVMAVGEPIDPGTFTEGGRKERVDAMTKEIVRRIAEQVSQAREAVDR